MQPTAKRQSGFACGVQAGNGDEREVRFGIDREGFRKRESEWACCRIAMISVRSTSEQSIERLLRGGVSLV